MAENARPTTSIERGAPPSRGARRCPRRRGDGRQRRGPLYEGGAGVREAGADDPITPDTMLRIASMTKMVTTVAALRLYEQGKLDLDAPVETYRPEFAELQMLEGFDGDTPRLRPPASRATVRQLMSHTSGLSYWFRNKDIDRYEQLTGVPNVLPGRTRCSSRRSSAIPARSSSTASTPTGSAVSSRPSPASRSTRSRSTSPARSG
jgi:hypothetical protein